ncbi:sialic acid-binding periplasmic protein SiaP [Betaproteobacteria bacterium]|nr:sialic acid-binding periplasmic protein SiaP [Betaproteobacteria bacterium]
MQLSFCKKHIVAAILALMMLPVSVASQAAEKVYQLSFTSHDPVTSQKSKDMQDWCDRIKKASSGRVDITLYAGGTIASAVEALDAVKSGSADVGWIFTSFFPGQFPITEAVMLPLIGVKTPQQAAAALWDLYEESEALRNELNRDYKALLVYTNPINRIATSKKPVATVADLKGLKFRAPAGTATDMITAWGGVPILMGPGDMYSALDKGVLDGFVFEYSGVKSFKLYEVAKYYTSIDFFASPFLILINKNTWNSLPANLQEIIMKESGREASIRFAKSFEADADSGLQVIKANGGKVITPDDKALDDFKVAARDYAQAWINKHQSDKFDARAYFNRLVELLAKHKDL